MKKNILIEIKNNILNFIVSLFPKKSIKSKIIYVLMTILILTLLIISYLIVVLIKNDKVKSLKERMNSICIIMIDSITRKTNNILNEVEIITKSDQLKAYITNFDDNYIIQLFRDKRNLFYEISYIKMNYEEELKVFNGEITQNYVSFNNNDNFMDFAKSENINYIISEEFILENFPCIRIFYKIKDEYLDTIGFLSCVIKTDIITEDLILKKFEDTGFIYAVNKDGKILYHINKENIFKTLNEKGNVKSPLINNILQMKNDFLRCNLMNLDGWIYYMPHKELNWSIIVTLPYKSFIKPINNFILYFGISIVIALLIFLIFINIIINKMTKGLQIVTDNIKKISEGQIIQLEKIGIKQNDEIGILADSFNLMLDSLSYKLNVIKQIADDNDLRMDISLDSEEDVLGKALTKMLISLNDILSQVNEASDQISVGADEVASVSQSLSQEATEQASLLEEITSSVTEINSHSKKNAESANNANILTKNATENAQKGNILIKKLVEAMNKIIDSSKEISKITKVIDDIAFQTNILSLNANVEAARAGKYGKAFAVVAEEVRGLASKSAEAVKKTSSIINNSIVNIESGNQLVIGTSNQLDNIVKCTQEAVQLVEEIVLASKEQTIRLDEISAGLGQIEQATHVNTASAEESASASEEFASQAKLLKELIARFKLKQTNIDVIK